jgi:hypothetical protein
MLNCYASLPPKQRLKPARTEPNFMKSVSGCSFSQGEKVRMRGNAALTLT